MSSSPLYVASVGKAQAILACFEDATDDLSLTDLVQLSGFDKSATQRYAYTLCELGLLEQQASSRRYRLGKKVLDLAFHYLRTHAFVESLNPLLLELCEQTGERVSLSLLDGEHLIHVMRHQLKTQEYQASLVGRRVPLFCTAGGRALLAAMTAAELSVRLSALVFKRFTAMTVADPVRLQAELEKVRQQGYALVVDEFIHGEVALGGAILDDEGRPYAALHISGATREWSGPQYAERFVPYLLNALSRIPRPLRTV